MTPHETENAHQREGRKAAADDFDQSKYPVNWRRAAAAAAVPRGRWSERGGRASTGVRPPRLSSHAHEFHVLGGTTTAAEREGLFHFGLENADYKTPHPRRRLRLLN